MSIFNKIFGKKSIVGGLDIGTYSIKIVQMDKSPSGFSMLKVLTAPTPTLAIKDGKVEDSAKVSDAIKQLIRNSQSDINKVYMSVSGQSIVIRPITMANMTEKELNNAIKFEAERYLPYPVSEAQIQGKKLPSTSGDDKNMEVLLIAAPNSIVRSAEETVKLSNMQPLAIDLEPFSLIRAVYYLVDPEIFKQTIALINLGATTSSINIFKDGELRHNRTISIAGNSFTKAIAQSLNLSYEEAEKIKKDKGCIRLEDDSEPVAPTTMRIYNVIVPVLSELVTEIQRSFDYYRSRYRGESVDNVILSGGTSRFKNIGTYLQKEMGLNCKLIDPFEKISISKSINMKEDELISAGPELMVSIGLALRHFQMTK